MYFKSHHNVDSTLDQLNESPWWASTSVCFQSCPGDGCVQFGLRTAGLIQLPCFTGRGNWAQRSYCPKQLIDSALGAVFSSKVFSHGNTTSLLVPNFISPLFLKVTHWNLFYSSVSLQANRCANTCIGNSSSNVTQNSESGWSCQDHEKTWLNTSLLSLGGAWRRKSGSRFYTKEMEPHSPWHPLESLPVWTK